MSNGDKEYYAKKETLNDLLRQVKNDLPTGIIISEKQIKDKLTYYMNTDLTERQRTILIEHYMKEKTIRQISIEMEKVCQSIAQSLSGGKRKLVKVYVNDYMRDK